jgi:hypothetical protein
MIPIGTYFTSAGLVCGSGNSLGSGLGSPEPVGDMSSSTQQPQRPASDGAGRAAGLSRCTGIVADGSAHEDGSPRGQPGGPAR